MRQLCIALSLEQIPQDAIICNPSLELSFQHLDPPRIVLYFLAVVVIGGEVVGIGGDCVIVLLSSLGQRQDLVRPVLAVQLEFPKRFGRLQIAICLVLHYFNGYNLRQNQYNHLTSNLSLFCLFEFSAAYFYKVDAASRSFSLSLLI